MACVFCELGYKQALNAAIAFSERMDGVDFGEIVRDPCSKYFLAKAF